MRTTATTSAPAASARAGVFIVWKFPYTSSPTGMSANRAGIASSRQPSRRVASRADGCHAAVPSRSAAAGHIASSSVPSA